MEYEIFPVDSECEDATAFAENCHGWRPKPGNPQQATLGTDELYGSLRLEFQGSIERAFQFRYVRRGHGLEQLGVTASQRVIQCKEPIRVGEAEPRAAIDERLDHLDGRALTRRVVKWRRPAHPAWPPAVDQVESPGSRLVEQFQDPIPLTLAGCISKFVGALHALGVQQPVPLGDSARR